MEHPPRRSSRQGREDRLSQAGPRAGTALTVEVGVAAEPPRPHTVEKDCLPRPCTVSPTPAVEYPNWDLPRYSPCPPLRLLSRTRLASRRLPAWTGCGVRRTTRGFRTHQQPYE
ncbi:hypothetical protein FNH09_06165 [Streptomyces adustus]|uniref:Uncharacterized protein n=1 Tax=Streptomyces adustus TaxID=1609272 RepID=A0A5N8VA72_9ACTN|nr:hypothetical protein [Streptomyces adustus]